MVTTSNNAAAGEGKRDASYLTVTVHWNKARRQAVVARLVIDVMPLSTTSLSSGARSELPPMRNFHPAPERTI